MEQRVEGNDLVVSALEEQIHRNEENTSLVNRLLQLFK
jgi:hypothetical protein